MRTRPIIALAVLANLALISAAHAAPFETLLDGGIRHTPSGFVFPKRVGVFQREQPRQYDRGGFDVSAGYDAGVLIAATVYVYPAPGDTGPSVLGREYASKRAEVLQGHRGVAILSESTATIAQGGKKQSGRRASFSYRDVFARTPQNLRSQLLVFRQGPNFIEYRFTYPRDHAEEAEKQISSFIRNWSWPSRSNPYVGSQG